MEIENLDLILQIDGLKGNDLINYVEKYNDKINELEKRIDIMSAEIDKLYRSLEIIKNICML